MSAFSPRQFGVFRSLLQLIHRTIWGSFRARSQSRSSYLAFAKPQEIQRRPHKISRKSKSLLLMQRAKNGGFSRSQRSGGAISRGAQPNHWLHPTPLPPLRVARVAGEPGRWASQVRWVLMLP